MGTQDRTAAAALICIVDSGPLYAVADLDDDDHDACMAALEEPGWTLVIPSLAVAEATYLIGTRLGARAESRFLASLSEYDVEVPLPEEWSRIAELVLRYRNLPLGGTDASVVALAERFATPLVATLDRRDFQAVRPAHCRAFDIAP